MNEPVRDDGDVRTDSNERCSLCHGEAGHHHMRCPNISKSQMKRRVAQVDSTGEPVRRPLGMLEPDEKRFGENGVPSSAESGEVVEVVYGTELEGDQKVPDGFQPEFDEHKVPPTGDDIVSSDMMWLVAKLCHEVNRVYCQSIADWSQPEWDDAPDWQRESAFKGVTMHFENPEATAEDSHKSWLAEKERYGWTYGPVKDEVLRQHPCFVPYNQLPPAQQYKDELFRTICRTFFGSDVEL